VTFARGERPPLPVRLVNVIGPLDVRKIRTKQRSVPVGVCIFASWYGFNVRTLDWEHGRGQPEAPVRAYLTVIDHSPEAVSRALRGSEKESHGRA
jgi:DNA-binding transcriptional regulator YiaG